MDSVDGGVDSVTVSKAVSVSIRSMSVSVTVSVAVRSVCAQALGASVCVASGTAYS